MRPRGKPSVLLQQARRFFPRAVQNDQVSLLSLLLPLPNVALRHQLPTQLGALADYQT